MRPELAAEARDFTSTASRLPFSKSMSRSLAQFAQPVVSKILTTDTGSDGGLRVLTCCCSLAMKLSAAHQAIGNIGCLQQGALGRKVRRQIPRGGD